MKKTILLLFLLTLVMVACSNQNTDSENTEKQNENKLENTGWKKEIKDLKLDYNPKLPTTMPIEVKETDFTPPPHRPIDTFVVSFYGEKGAHIAMSITNGGTVRSSIDYEHVKIGNLDGKYFEKNAEMKIKELVWKEENIHYRLKFFQVRSDVKVTKEDLIETAKSFK